MSAASFCRCSSFEPLGGLAIVVEGRLDRLGELEALARHALRLHELPLIPPGVVEHPLPTKNLAAGALIGLGPARQLQAVLAGLGRKPGLRMHPVDDHMHMGMRGVVVADDQRLVLLHLQDVERLLRRLEHLRLGRFLLRMPGERIGVDRLGQFAPGHLHTGRFFEGCLILGGRHHDPPGLLRIGGAQIDRLGPGDPRIGEPYRFALEALVMEMVERRPLERAAGDDLTQHRCELRDQAVDTFDQDRKLGRKGRGGALRIELLVQMVQRIADPIECLQP